MVRTAFLFGGIDVNVWPFMKNCDLSWCQQDKKVCNAYCGVQEK
jgi:hypothetical protein